LEKAIPRAVPTKDATMAWEPDFAVTSPKFEPDEELFEPPTLKLWLIAALDALAA